MSASGDYTHAGRKIVATDSVEFWAHAHAALSAAVDAEKPPALARRCLMITAACATFALVFLRAWQQQNVIGAHYWTAAVTSYGMALAEVGVVLSVIEHQWAAVPWLGTGGALGVTAAMVAHRYVFSRAGG